MTEHTHTQKHLPFSLNSHSRRKSHSRSHKQRESRLMGQYPLSACLKPLCELFMIMVLNWLVVSALTTFWKSDFHGFCHFLWGVPLDLQVWCSLSVLRLWSLRVKRRSSDVMEHFGCICDYWDFCHHVLPLWLLRLLSSCSAFVMDWYAMLALLRISAPFLVFLSSS